MDANQTTTDFPDLLSELKWRGLLHQATDEAALAEHFATGTRKVYCGFDPTADSLTIGNLVPMMLLKHVQRHGHTPIVVMGGATGRIGDPSGKSAERTLMSDEDIERNLRAQRPIFERVLGADVKIVDNYSWWKDLSFLKVLRDIGKHFSVNVMMQKDSVRDRLHNRDQGISFTEFSYQILQGYDFLYLAREEGVTVQCGGSDQWGNIVAGTDLIRRVAAQSVADAVSFAARAAAGGLDAVMFALQAAGSAAQAGMCEAFAFTAPLVTKADGGKFGKSEAGAVWLSAHRTSSYAFHQFWLNAADADVERFLKMFTLLAKGEIESIVKEHAEAPEKRLAQRALADAATELVHGQEAVDRANAAAKALFSGEVAGLDEATLVEVFASVPSSQHDYLGPDSDARGWSIVDALVATNLASSKSQARQFVNDGAVTINGFEKATLETRIKKDHLLHGHIVLLRRGKKNWHVMRIGPRR